MKSLFNFLLLVLIISISTAEITFAQENITLQEAFERALMENHDIRILQFERRQSENNVFRGNAGQLPTLDLVGSAELSIEDADLEVADFDVEGPPQIEQVSIDGSEQRVFNAAVELNYTLFDGFRGKYRYRQLQSENRTTQLSTRIEMENTLLEVAIAYLDVLRERENVKVREENLLISEERLMRIREDRAFGSATELDVLNAEVNFNADTIEITSAKTGLENARRNLSFLLGMEDDEVPNPVDQFRVNKDLAEDALLANALEENAALLLAEEQIRNAELGKNISVSGRYPSISLRGSYGYFRQRIDASNLPLIETIGVTAGVTLRYNLFNGSQRNREIQNREISIKSNREQLNSIQKEIRTEVMNTYSRYSNILEQIRLSRLNLETAEKNFENSREAFQLGQITSIELREAQVNLLNEQLRINNLTFLAKQNEFVLLILSGRFFSDEI